MFLKSYFYHITFLDFIALILMCVCDSYVSHSTVVIGSLKAACGEIFLSLQTANYTHAVHMPSCTFDPANTFVSKTNASVG